MHNYKLEGQWNSTADVMVAYFQDSGHTFFRTSSAMDRGFLKKKGGRCTIHFSADSSNADLLFPTINAANQLRIHRPIADWCDALTQSIIPKFCQKLDPGEGNTLVRTLETNVQAARSRLRSHQERFEKLASEIKICQICEFAGFMRESLCWTILPNHSRRSWFRRKDRVMQRVYVTLVITEILDLLGGFVDTPGSVQFVKSESYVVLIKKESRYRYRLRRETDLTLRL